MSDMNFICPTCKRPINSDNEIIEYLVKEKDRYRDILSKRTKELDRTRKALDIAVDILQEALNYDEIAEEASEALEQITEITKGE